MLVGNAQVSGLYFGNTKILSAYLGAKKVFGQTTSYATIAPHVGTTANGNNNAPKITIPATASIGDIVIIHLTLNNTDLITSKPSTVSEVVASPTTGQFANHLYWCLIDGVSVNPGMVLTWAMSGTRAWAFLLEAYSGVDQASPIHAAAFIQTTNTHTAPTITTTAQSFLVEAVGMKPSSGTITAITAPSGWAEAQFKASPASYSPAMALGSPNTNPKPAGSYGGETWTPSTSSNPEGLYTLALNPAKLSGGQTNLYGQGTYGQDTYGA